MTAQELINFAWKHGHFWNPLYPGCHNVTEADLPTLTLQDNVVIDAMKSV